MLISSSSSFKISVFFSDHEKLVAPWISSGLKFFRALLLQSSSPLSFQNGLVDFLITKYLHLSRSSCQERRRSRFLCWCSWSAQVKKCGLATDLPLFAVVELPGHELDLDLLDRHLLILPAHCPLNLTFRLEVNGLQNYLLPFARTGLTLELPLAWRQW